MTHVADSNKFNADLLSSAKKNLESQLEDTINQAEKDRRKAEETIIDLRSEKARLKSESSIANSCFQDVSLQLDQLKRDFAKIKSQNSLMKVKVASIKGQMDVLRAEKRNEILYFENAIEKLEAELYVLRKFKERYGVDETEPEGTDQKEKQIQKSSLDLDFTDLLEYENNPNEMASPIMPRNDDSFEERTARVKSAVRCKSPLPEARFENDSVSDLKPIKFGDSDFPTAPECSMSILTTTALETTVFVGSKDLLSQDETDAMKEVILRFEKTIEGANNLSKLLQNKIDEQDKTIGLLMKRLQIYEKKVAERDIEIAETVADMTKIKLDFAIAMNKLQHYIKEEKSAQRIANNSQASTFRRSSQLPEINTLAENEAEQREERGRGTTFFNKWFK